MEIIATGIYNQLTQFNHPWPFYIVDNFLPPEAVTLSIKLSKQMHLFRLVDFWCDNYNQVSSDPGNNPCKRSLILRGFPNLNNYVTSSVNKHIHHLLPTPHYFTPDLVVCDPGYKYNIHKDHPDKKLSIVVFIHPTMSNATILCDGKRNQYEVAWRVNRALIFKQENQGPHFYWNNTVYPRVTMNVYVTGNMAGDFSVTNDV